MTDDDVDLYRPPADCLRREMAWLKERLKEERADLQRFVDLAKELKGEMAGLLDSARRDVQATEDLIAMYRKAIRVVK